MKFKISRPSFSKSNKNINNMQDLSPNRVKKIHRMTLKFTQSDYGEVLHRIHEKRIQSYIKEQKEFEKKAGSIITKHIYNYANQFKDNFYKMFVANVTSEKSHRIRLKYIEGILGFNYKEMVCKYYNKSESYENLRMIFKTYNNSNIMCHPNYYVNETVYIIMEKFFEKKVKYILRKEKDNKLYYIKYQNLKNRRFYIDREISNKIKESFIEDDNSIDLEDNLKNLNDESFSYSHNNISNSSFKVKQLITNLNNNLEENKKRKKQLKKKMFKIITKNYDIKEEKLKENVNRRKSQIKPVTFKENNLMQKIYLDNYLTKKFGWLKSQNKNDNENKTESVKKNNLLENKIYFQTVSNEKITNNNPINIYTYKNKNLDGKSLNNFKPTGLFIYNFFKQQNIEKKKRIKNTIINCIKEYQSLKSQKIISFLKSKEKASTKNFTLSSSRKRLNKNFVQGDGYTTEVTKLKDLLNKQKLKEKRNFHSKGKDFLHSSLFFRDNCTNYESMTSRIKTNLLLFSKNKKYKSVFPLLTKQS